MSRKLRIEYPGAIYHLMNRGDRREDIFKADRQESGEEAAQRIVVEGMERLGWMEGNLQERRKGDKGKVTLARRLRKETTMSLKCVARRLQRGSWTYVSNLLREKPNSNLCQ